MLESVRAVTVCTLFLFVPSRKALHFGALRNAGSKKGCLLEPCVTQEAKKGVFRSPALRREQKRVSFGALRNAGGKKRVSFGPCVAQYAPQNIKYNGENGKH